MTDHEITRRAQSLVREHRLTEDQVNAGFRLVGDIAGMGGDEPESMYELRREVALATSAAWDAAVYTRGRKP